MLPTNASLDAAFAALTPDQHRRWSAAFAGALIAVAQETVAEWAATQAKEVRDDLGLAETEKARTVGRSSLAISGRLAQPITERIAPAMSTSATDTICAPAGPDGHLVDTGFSVGEQVTVTIGGETFLRVVLGPASRPYESVVWDGPAWARRIEKQPAIRVACVGQPDLWLDVPVSRVERAEAVA